jgi:hypothetical protein
VETVVVEATDFHTERAALFCSTHTLPGQTIAR